MSELIKIVLDEIDKRLSIIPTSKVSDEDSSEHFFRRDELLRLKNLINNNLPKPRYKVGDRVYYDSFGKKDCSMIIANVLDIHDGNPMYEDDCGNAVFERDIIEPDSRIEIPFGAKDSELIEESIIIPDGCYATIEGDRVILKKREKPEHKINLDKEQDLICIKDFYANDGTLLFTYGKKYHYNGHMCFVDDIGHNRPMPSNDIREYFKEQSGDDRFISSKLIELTSETSEDLDEAAEEFCESEWDGLHDNDGEPLYTQDYLEYAFKAGAKWQKEKDRRIVFVPQKQGKSWRPIYEKALDDLMKQLEKDAVSAEVCGVGNKDKKQMMGCEFYTSEPISPLKIGDKVKLIIIEDNG